LRRGLRRGAKNGERGKRGGVGGGVVGLCFPLYQPRPTSRLWEALAYGLGQHWLRVSLVAGHVIHCAV